MLDLTDKQAEIIKTFIDHYRDGSNKISQGIPAKKLKDYGIEPKTFRNHKDYFLENYFLRLSTVEYHGNRNYFYFQITRLGVLAYLKWFSNSNSTEIWLDRDFFPDLHKHWVELVETFEQVLFDVARKTLDRIEIRPQIVREIQGQTVYGGKLYENITIPIGTIDVKIFRKYKQPDVQKNPTNLDWGVTETFESLNQDIDDKITQRFTFLLLFNLLNSGIDAGEFSNLMFPNYVKPFDDRKEYLTEEDKLEKKSEIATFHKKMQENVSKLFSIINQDESLHSLMKSTISEISDTLANKTTLQLISKKLD